MHTLTAEAIRRLADGASLVRGRGYLVEGRVRDAVLLDDRLTGTCIGSMPIDYEMEISLKPGRIDSARCTCPRGDFCKHLVALALLFIERPDEVARLDRDRLIELLANRGPGELADTLIGIATTDPSLVGRLVHHLDERTQKQAPGTPPASISFTTLAEEYRRRAADTAPGAYSDPYRGGQEFAAEIGRLIMQNRRIAAGEPARLLAFYTGVYRAIEDEIGHLDDSDGVIGGITWDCASGMGEIVGSEDLDSSIRREWLHAIVPLYVDDSYGIGDGLGEAIRAVGTTVDASFAVEEIRAALVGSTPNVEHSSRKRTAYELIADLYRSMGREDQIDALYTEAELYFHAVMHRLAMDDVAPALSLAKEYLRSGYDVRRTADALLETGHAGDALELLDHVVPLLEERSPHREDILTTWALAAARADAPERALEIAYQRFSEYPKVDSYRAVMAVAEEQGVAHAYDRMMVDALEDDPRALTEVHIARRDSDAALAAFARLTGWSGDDLTLRLAALARIHRPRESRKLIEEVVERRIARRSRRAYSDAAAVANRLREVIGEEEFSAYLEDLRSRYRHLPAFRDELNKAFGSSARFLPGVGTIPPTERTD